MSNCRPSMAQARIRIHLLKRSGIRSTNMPSTKSVTEERSVVSQEEWVAARKAHLVREKEITRLRDQLYEERRKLPWVKINKEYVFEGRNGKVTLADLFEGRS